MQFNKLTEAAMQLMDAGEADVYTQNKVRILCSHLHFSAAAEEPWSHGPLSACISMVCRLSASAVSLRLCLEACAGRSGAGKVSG